MDRDKAEAVQEDGRSKHRGNAGYCTVTARRAGRGTVGDRTQRRQEVGRWRDIEKAGRPKVSTQGGQG